MRFPTRQLRTEFDPTALIAHPVLPTGAEQTARDRSIPSLDGLRAISVSLVVLAHYSPAARSTFWNGYLFLMGQLGVSMFFVISGFLITFLLCKEQAERGTISLRNFYLRRAFRIFPAFYMYLGVAAILAAGGVFQVRTKEFLIAGAYLWNYYMPQAASVLGHTWSLALEEQFYLFWPACLRVLKPARASSVAVILILLEPVLRVVTFVHFPALRQSGKISAMFHTRIDTIMFGCFIALLWRQERFKEAVHRYLRPPVFFAAILFLIVLDPWLNIYFRRTYHPFWLTLDGCVLSLVLIYLVRNPLTPSGRFVNLRLLRFVGVLSYSLYLWQQMFAGLWQRWFPLNLCAALGCATLSFYFVERPGLRLRDRVLSHVR